METKRALIVVDVQNDFCEGGSLAVAGGADIALKITDFVNSHQHEYDVVVASLDWHDHDSDNGRHFALDGEPDFKDTWPVHCVGNTEGAMFHPNLSVAFHRVFTKGQGAPAYSAFQGREVGYRAAPLDDYLAYKAVTEVDVVGIATDYCVKATALDSAKSGYSTRLILDLTAAVGGNAAKVHVVDELTEIGIRVENSA